MDDHHQRHGRYEPMKMSELRTFLRRLNVNLKSKIADKRQQKHLCDDVVS